KRPDGLTLIPWSKGKSLTWDVTVINPLADSYVASYQSPGDAAELAADRKVEKYSSIPATLIFQPLAFETLGAINSSGAIFFCNMAVDFQVLPMIDEQPSFFSIVCPSLYNVQRS